MENFSEPPPPPRNTHHLSPRICGGYPRILYIKEIQVSEPPPPPPRNTHHLSPRICGGYPRNLYKKEIQVSGNDRFYKQNPLLKRCGSAAIPPSWRFLRRTTPSYCSPLSKGFSRLVKEPRLYWSCDSTNK